MGYQKPSTHTTRDNFASSPRLKMHEPNNRASWKRYGGEGVANAEFIFYPDGRVGLSVEETSFASKAMGDKRDVTRGGHMEISKDARDKLFIMLAEVVEHRDIRMMLTALNGAAAIIARPNEFNETERLAVLHDVNQARGYTEN